VNRVRKAGESFSNYRGSLKREELRITSKLKGTLVWESVAIEFINYGPGELTRPVRRRRQGTYDPYNKIPARRVRKHS